MEISVPTLLRAQVQATRTFEFCAREASQTLGGASQVREGKGEVVERLCASMLWLSGAIALFTVAFVQLWRHTFF